MSSTGYEHSLASDEATTVNTVATQPETAHPLTSSMPQPDNEIPSAYSVYLEIRQQVEAFERLANDDQAVAITLPAYPFFTETRLQSIFVHQSGTVSIIGQAKAGKAVSVREQVNSLSYALSLVYKPARDAKSERVEVGFISSI
ncbi:MAG TPA: hypothetical protein ENK26_03845 [Gammaproteobacteria bacterium]|nr:hypothetical protein [Gammaproteobacteria bacterium]